MARTNYSPTFPMYPGNAAAVTVSDTNNFEASIVFAGGGGSVRVLTAQGQDVTFTGLNPGSIIPVQVIRVWSTGTSPTTGIIRIY